MLLPNGRVVMISGATRGIGRAILQRLLAAGCTVSAGVRDAAHLPKHANLTPHPYDAAELGSAEAWVAATRQRHGRIDALVNAAASTHRAHSWMLTKRRSTRCGPSTPRGRCASSAAPGHNSWQAAAGG